MATGNDSPSLLGRMFSSFSQPPTPETTSPRTLSMSRGPSSEKSPLPNPPSSRNRASAKKRTSSITASRKENYTLPEVIELFKPRPKAKEELFSADVPWQQWWVQWIDRRIASILGMFSMFLYCFGVLGNNAQNNDKDDKDDEDAIESHIRMREILAERQTSQRYDQTKIWNKISQIKKILEPHVADKDTYNTINELVMNKTDAVGASVIHLAYLYGMYTQGQWLIENFPEAACMGYSDKPSAEYADAFKSGEDNMPFSNENVVHMTIVRRNHAEARFLLDFFRDAPAPDNVIKAMIRFSSKTEDLTYKRNGFSTPEERSAYMAKKMATDKYKRMKADREKWLGNMLCAKVTGTFFSKKGKFYFGETPLHFAVAANDQEMFNLVLGYYSSCSSNALFIPASNGDNVFHLCVYHKLHAMYEHISYVARCILKQEIEIVIASRRRTLEQVKMVVESNVKKGATDDDSRISESRKRTSSRMTSFKGVAPDAASAPPPIPRPILNAAGGADSSEIDAKKATADPSQQDNPEFPMDRYYTPMTLAEKGAIGSLTFPSFFGGRLKICEEIDLHEFVMRGENWQNWILGLVLADRLSLCLNDELHSPLTMAADQGDKDTLAFFIKQAQYTVWSYGPTTCYHIDLDGFEEMHKTTKAKRKSDSKENSPVSLELPAKDNAANLPVSLEVPAKDKDAKDKEAYWPEVTDIDKSRMQGVVQLCVNKGGDIVEIEAVKKLIETKWQRTGKDRVFFDSYMMIIFTCVFSLACLLHAPSQHLEDGLMEWLFISEEMRGVVFFLWPYATLVAAICCFHLFLAEQPIKLMLKGAAYWQQCSYTNILRWICIKLLMITLPSLANCTFFSKFCQDNLALVSQMPMVVRAARLMFEYDHFKLLDNCHLLMGVPSLSSFVSNALGYIEVYSAQCTSLLSVFLWVHVIFFSLLPFDSTGPLLLKIRHTIFDTQVLFFFFFFLLIVLGFGLSIMVLNKEQWALSHKTLPMSFKMALSVMFEIRELFFKMVYLAAKAMEIDIDEVDDLPTSDRNDRDDELERYWNLLEAILVFFFNMLSKMVLFNVLLAVMQDIFKDLKEAIDQHLLVEKYHLTSGAICRELMNKKDEHSKEQIKRMYAVKIAEENQAEKLVFELQIDSSEWKANAQDTAVIATAQETQHEQQIHSTTILLRGGLSGSENPRVKHPVVLHHTQYKDEGRQAHIARHVDKIRYGTFWRNTTDQHPMPNTPIRHHDVVHGVWLPVEPTYKQFCLYYTKQLEREGHTLTIQTSHKTALLIIDAQKDFHDGGSLAVSGANEDSQRVARMITEHPGEIDEIFYTQDSHFPDHIAHAVSWKDANGNHPASFTTITATEVEEGIWTPTNEDWKEYAIYYCRVLEESTKFQLTIWPPHCIVGSPGHDLVDDIDVAIKTWEEYWKKHKVEKKPTIIRKGMNKRTEMYSAIQSEVIDYADHATHLNSSLVTKLNSQNKIYICGQALSHCVNHTCRDLLNYWLKSPSHVYLLRDGSSPVGDVPGETKYQKAAEEFIDEMRGLGVHITTCEEAFKRGEYSLHGKSEKHAASTTAAAAGGGGGGREGTNE